MPRKTPSKPVAANSILSDVAEKMKNDALDTAKEEWQKKLREEANEWRNKLRDAQSEIEGWKGKISAANREWPDSARWAIGAVGLICLVVGVVIGKLVFSA